MSKTKKAPAKSPGPVKASQADQPEEKFLLGSSLQPALVQIGDQELQLGDVVRRAKADSGLSVEAWNELAEDDREKAISRAVAALQAEWDAEDAKKKPARILVDCHLGKINTVARLLPDALAAAKAGGYVDDHPAALRGLEEAK